MIAVRRSKFGSARIADALPEDDTHIFADWNETVKDQIIANCYWRDYKKRQQSNQPRSSHLAPPLSRCQYDDNRHQRSHEEQIRPEPGRNAKQRAGEHIGGELFHAESPCSNQQINAE